MQLSDLQKITLCEETAELLVRKGTKDLCPDTALPSDAKEKAGYVAAIIYQYLFETT